MNDFKDIWQKDGVGWSRVCIKGTGVGVWFLAGRFMAGETIRELAKDYGFKDHVIESAIRLFLCSLQGQRGEKVETTMRETLKALGQVEGKGKGRL